jgi:Fe-S-cluster containining protein
VIDLVLIGAVDQHRDGLVEDAATDQNSSGSRTRGAGRAPTHRYAAHVHGEGEGEGEGEGPLDAGAFSTWIREIGQAIDGSGEADVACDGCTACCRASQFIHIAPDEMDALAHIPKAVLFPAPRLPRGHMLMGYDQHGRCPMLISGACSIYEHRPRTCRTYDCRVFPATGFDAADDGKQDIAARARWWKFQYPGEQDRSEQAAVRAAAAFLRERVQELPPLARPSTASQAAVLSVELHGLFMAGDGTLTNPTPEEVRVEIARRSDRPPPTKSGPSHRGTSSRS